MAEEKIYSEIIMIDPLKVNPNSYNPNLMTDEQFNSLVADFQENGWIGQPVIVAKKKNGKLEIIDGFHRWKAGMALGFTKIPVTIFEPKDDDHQKIVTIAMNSKRGEMSPLKLSKLVTELSQKYSMQELSTKLGFSMGDLKDQLALNQVTQEFIETLKKQAELREMEVPRAINFAVTSEQIIVINDALEKAKGKSKGEKLFAICEAYLKQ